MLSRFHSPRTTVSMTLSSAHANKLAVGALVGPRQVSFQRPLSDNLIARQRTALSSRSLSEMLASGCEARAADSPGESPAIGETAA